MEGLQIGWRQGFGEALYQNGGSSPQELTGELGIATRTVQKLETGGETRDERVMEAVRGFLDSREDG